MEIKVQCNYCFKVSTVILLEFKKSDKICKCCNVGKLKIMGYLTK